MINQPQVGIYNVRHYVGIVTITVANQNGYLFLHNHIAIVTPSYNYQLDKQFSVKCMKSLHVWVTLGAASGVVVRVTPVLYWCQEDFEVTISDSTNNPYVISQSGSVSITLTVISKCGTLSAPCKYI